MIKEIEVGGVKHSITLADDMVGQGLVKDENGVVSVDVENLDINEEKLVKTTWAELKALRDEAKLNAGTFYRITDYVTTTTQSETKSANHPFDVIVLALSENTLCEDAKAILHEGDTYFADSDLSAWKLKYCLDNDKTRFEWADETNGKGVIYRMVDEKRNDCPYDFKNILFYNTKLTIGTTSDRYYYTFSYVIRGVLYDGTTEKQVEKCYKNAMGERYNDSGVLRLNMNVFSNYSFENFCRFNIFGNSCYANTFGYACQYNTLGNNCYSNVFGYECYYNALGDKCSSNTFNPRCSSNTLVNSCYSNVLEPYCGNNTLGNGCSGSILKYNLQNRYLDANKTFITLNEEFYDDGSGQLVPIKHPDLSTQPSILPYKFIGQYVYEQLIPTSELRIDGDNVAYIPTSLIDGNFILDCCVIGTEGATCVYIERSVAIDGWILSHDSILGRGFKFFNYIKIVYTSMPEDSSYYGYNKY